MAEESSVAAKGFEKVAGTLEKLVDNRMLVLWAAFILYFDIWLIATNIDMAALSIDSAIIRIKALNMRTIVSFIAIFSVLMCLVFPALRYVYTTLLLHYGNFRYSNSNRTPDQQKMSNWAAGTVGFGIWDLFSGAFSQTGNYSGYLLYVAAQLEKNSLATTILALGFTFFIFFCLAAALEREY
ncbi:hypothetical protein [Massilia sp. YMA4]|uniref:hypothetical protein n=1 Tax=Massilia sp. YMA4 TaxID=1593482 RepID=UPI001582EBBE|nr:hypothetical protein [Massilia sp. YMA4]